MGFWMKLIIMQSFAFTLGSLGSSFLQLLQPGTSTLASLEKIMLCMRRIVFFWHVLSEHSTVKMLPEVLAGAAENRFPVSVGASSRQAELSRLITKLRQGLMQKPRFEHPIVLKGNALLHAHVHRLEMSALLRVDLHKLLGNAS